MVVSLFSFFRTMMLPGQPMSASMQEYYKATLKVMLVIIHDYPEFLADFHFNFVNSLPEQCI